MKIVLLSVIMKIVKNIFILFALIYQKRKFLNIKALMNVTFKIIYIVCRYSLYIIKNGPLSRSCLNYNYPVYDN